MTARAGSIPGLGAQFFVPKLWQDGAPGEYEPFHAVIGGFHLAPYPPEYLAETLSALKEIDPDYLVPLHCTGEPFFDLAKGQLGPKVIRAYTGTRLDFS